MPAGGRQGGDTVADALLIPSLPFQDTGTTSGYTDAPEMTDCRRAGFAAASGFGPTASRRAPRLRGQRR